MEDVNNQQPTAIQEPVETPTEQPSQVAEPTADTPVEETPAETPEERQIPISVLQAERKRRQELQRKLAQRDSESRISNVDPDDYESWAANPLSQELILKVARQELSDYARDLLEQYPTVPAPVKKAILKNVRGFVKEDTTDVETAKIDLQEFIEDYMEELVAGEPAPLPTPGQKGFPVAPSNLPATEKPGSNPAEVQKILDKPVDEWTEEEAKIASDYSRQHPKG